MRLDRLFQASIPTLVQDWVQAAAQLRLGSFVVKRITGIVKSSKVNLGSKTISLCSLHLLWVCNHRIASLQPSPFLMMSMSYVADHPIRVLVVTVQCIL